MYLGSDLSYVNEVEDGGGLFYVNGAATDPFRILRDAGASIARLRLWHTPDDWTHYSTLTDVERSIRRARALGYRILLDFHYSDTWADPAKQIIPAAWAGIDDLAELEQALANYTREVLLHLHTRGLMPEFVQVGNEINNEILMPGPYDGRPIRWERNARLLNAAIGAVRRAGHESGAQPQVMLHIAQPEFVINWFDAATAAGVHDFDIIALSYYPKWSSYSIERMGQTVEEARRRYNKEVMLVEVAYPWTQERWLASEHLLRADALLPEYPATPEGQRDFMVEITRTVRSGGGSGVIYWEAAWISTAQKPSIWENATFFDYSGAAHAGITFLAHDYSVEGQE